MCNIGRIFLCNIWLRIDLDKLIKVVAAIKQPLVYIAHESATEVLFCHQRSPSDGQMYLGQKSSPVHIIKARRLSRRHRILKQQPAKSKIQVESMTYFRTVHFCRPLGLHYPSSQNLTQVQIDLRCQQPSALCNNMNRLLKCCTVVINVNVR